MSDQVKPLLVALKAEEDGYQIYGRMAKRSENENGKKMFEHLVKEEARHIRTIKDRLKKLGALPETKDIAEKVYSVSELDFPDKELSDLEVIARAITEEKDARAFYLRSAEQTQSPEEKQMYQLLANDEASHAEILEKEAARLKTS